MTAITLTESDRRKLNDLESIIEAGMKTFVEVGAALSIIREQRLYRDTHATFEAYTEERWGWSASRARQLISAAEVVEQVGSVTPSNTPTNEAQARELVSVEPEKRAEVWETATKTAEAEGRKKPTSDDVRVAAGKPRRDRTPAPKAKPQSKVDALREQRERQAEERAAQVATPVEQPPLSVSTVEQVPASTVVMTKELLTTLAAVPTIGSVDAARIAEALTPSDMEQVRRVRETCQRIMTEYAKLGTVAA